MKALLLNATWDPRPGYRLSPRELETGKAIDTSQVWREPALAFIEAPTPNLKSDQVLVRVRACGVCGSDAHCLETDTDGYAMFSGASRLPTILGHEFAGEVVAVGDDVAELKVGDRVAAESILWCGRCVQCRSGNVNQCSRIEMVGFSSSGAFADCIAISERHCWKLDLLEAVCSTEQEIFETGALIEPIGCAYNALFVAGGGLLPGQTVAVYGAGPIGLGAVMLARLAGASKIFAFDVSTPRCDLAKKLGADYVGNPNTMDRCMSQMLMELTDGEGVDVQIEAAGAASDTVPEIRRCFSENGKMIFLGRHDSVAQVDFNPIVSKANQMIGSRGHAGHGIYDKIIKLMGSGRMPAHEMITSRFDFPSAICAVEKAIERVDGKVMVSLA